MIYTVKDIVRILGANPQMLHDEKAVVTEVVIDSRTLADHAGSLFFAICGERHDGHQYLEESYQKGVRNFVVSTTIADPERFPEANILRVSDTLSALQDLAAAHRGRFNIPVIGITGSNGKTIIKEWLFQLLSPDKKIVRSPKSYNSQVGVPLSVWQMKEEHELAIFEAGISRPDEMEKLQPIIKPEIGIFTNIGQAHEKNFINAMQKAGEKLKLFTKVEVLIYCPDYFEIQDRIMRSELDRNIHVFTWSFKNKADLKISDVVRDGQKTTIHGHYKSNDLFITIPFTDDASVENAIHCWAVMLYMGYHPNVIADRMLQLTPVAMRLELKEGINHCSVINDSYNNDYNSLSIAIDFLNQQKQHIHKTVILSDILQSALDDDELYAKVGGLLKEKGVSRIIGIGKAISHQADKFSIQKDFFEDTASFLERFPLSSFQNETILLKGARIFEFEQISRLLQQKTHDTVLEIDLNALLHNLNYYRSLLNPGTRVMAMVKAFSYGSGSFEIANVLQFNHIDYLAVAYADEGIELRKAGIHTPILVMSPEADSLDAMITYGLEPEIYSMRILKLLIDVMAARSDQESARVLVHLKLDTGMHRLGFAPEEVDDLIQLLSQHKHIVVRSAFSHLAASEDPAEDSFTRAQIASLVKMGTRLKTEFGEGILLHILNSSGITRFPDAQLDMVRLGIGLYGIGHDEKEQQLLQNVGTLRSIITQIKAIPKGESVGYNRKWIAKRNARIAIVPVGYADGLDRRLGNGRGSVVIGASTVPIIGNVCMDMCMVDVTDIAAEEGDVVEIFGKSYTVHQFAQTLDTIPYEVLTSISARVKRVYFQE